ncbi:MAG: DASH family cryptochrome [Bacteroidota bacterium]
MVKSNKIVWFRDDLRLHDHEPLSKAIESEGNIIPLFIFDSEWLEESEIGEPRKGAFQLQFLLESVKELRQNLKELGSELIFRQGNPEVIIADLVKKLRISEIYTAESPHFRGTRLEAEIEKRVWPLGAELKTFWHQSLYHVNDIPWPISKLPNIFTQFRKESEKSVEVRNIYETPNKIDTDLPSEFEIGVIPVVVDLGFKRPVYDERSVLKFRGGEKAGLERLNKYIWEDDLLKNYKNTRNGMIGADYSSKLSAWLAYGCISPKLIYWEIKKYEKERVKNSSTYWLFFELLWRDYFQFVARKSADKLFEVSGIKQKELSLNNDFEVFDKWKKGETGIPFIDANMRELNQTGFISNRGRQNAASFLVHDLNINWTWGALYFENRLIDYDTSSNWCNWNYVAGVGNDPREDRYFNTISQAKTYDGKGEFVKLWIPELRDFPPSEVHHPNNNVIINHNNDSENSIGNYPSPIIPFNTWL